MKPAPFGYVRADSVEHAVARLAEANDDGEGKVIAGGQSLMPLLALRLAQPSLLVDINRVPGLDRITTRPGGGLRIGALTRHRTLAGQDRHPLLAEAARWVGTRRSVPAAPSAAAWPTPTRPPNSPSWPPHPLRSRSSRVRAAGAWSRPRTCSLGAADQPGRRRAHRGGGVPGPRPVGLRRVRPAAR